MRVAVMADIGQPVYHVGDEAIGHAVRDELVGRGIEPVMLTRNVRHTQAYFGPVAAAPTVCFPRRAGTPPGAHPRPGRRGRRSPACR